MSEVAINALTVDLTRLLSSAKGRQSTEDLAETTSLFRQCKQNSGVKENSDTVARDIGGETSTAPGSPVGSTLTRKTPLPDKVDSCCYAYAPLGDQKPTTVEAAAAEEEIKARPPGRRVPPASPSHGDVDRRAYTYADGFKPRRRDQQPPTAAYFSFSQNGASRKWHDRRSNRRASGPHFPVQHHQQQQQQQQDQQQHQQQQDQQLRRDPDAQVIPEALSRGGEGGTDTDPTVGREDAQPRDAVLVGEAWSENAAGGVEGSLGRERDRGSVGETGSQRPSAESRRDSSELHEFLYREGRSREDRRRAKQAERDRELTFRPRLATTKYWASAAARRRRRSRADDFGLATGRGRDGAGAAAEGARVGGGVQGREAAAAAAAGGVPARFEMLYEDSKAQLLRSQEDRVKIPAACTFRPQLISHRPTSRGRSRHVARAATAAAAATTPNDADMGRETYVFDDSAELFDESVNDPHARNERGDSDGLDNGNDDDSQAWVNSLVFGDNDDDGHVDNSRSSGDNDNGDNNNNNTKRTEEGQGRGRGQGQYGDRPRRFDRHGSRLRAPRAGLRGENGGGYGAICSSGSSNGGLSAVDGPSEEGSKGSRRAGGCNRRDYHRRSRSLPSRSRGVTRSGLSEGAGERTEAVGTPSYAERLYRGHDEQQQVWARRRQERARLELKGCTFRPRLDQNSQNLGRAGRTYLEGQNGEARRRSSSAVRWKRTTPQEEEEEEEDEEASGRGGGMAAAAAAHERLYQAAELVRVRRREEVAERRKAETVGCTFQPEVNHAPAASCAAAFQGRGRSTYYGGTAKRNGGDRRGDRRGVRSGSVNSNNDCRNTSRDNGSSVFDRLVAAGEEAKQKKAMLGKMTPPGCTFRPQVNVHGNGKRPPGHTSSSAGSTQNGGGTFAAQSQPHPQHPPPSSYGGAPRTAENVSNFLPPPPPRTGSYHSNPGNDGHTKGGNRPPPPRRPSAGARGGSGDWAVTQMGRRSGGGSVVGSSDTTAHHAAEKNFLRELAAAASTAAASAADAVPVAEVDEEGARIPYRESRFSPRRGRRKQGGGCDGNGNDDHGDGESGRESPACERLFELGHRQQRKRNDSPRDTPQSQRARDELEELKLCTFSPVLFTKAYRRPRPRLATGAPSNRMEANG